MTDREKAIVMAYTGVAMLTGDKLKVFYEYLSEKEGRPVYTHEIVGIMEKQKAKIMVDFVAICEEDGGDPHGS